MHIDAVLKTIEADRTPSYLAAPFPCRLDESIATLILMHRLADEDARFRMRRGLNPQHAGRLLRYGERMAALARRLRSGERLFDGLMAVVIEDLDVDPRRTVGALAELRAAARELGVDFAGLVHRAERSASPRMTELLAAFAHAGGCP